MNRIANAPEGTTPTRSPTRRLLALNAALLALLVTVSVAPDADAQARAQPSRARGEYTMVGGKISGGNSNAVFVVDAANREMITLRWDSSRRQMLGIGYRDLTTDLIIDPQR